MPQPKTKRAIRKAVRKVARDPKASKASKTGRGEALGQARGQKPTKGVQTTADDRKKAIAGSGKKASRYVQLRNPISERYVKVDSKNGRVVAQKRTSGPYQGVPVVK